MNRLKVGDRIKVTSDYPDQSIQDKEGIIVKISEGGIISIEFDEFINGHSCGGLTKDGHGWNVVSIGLHKLEILKPSERPSLIASL